MHGRDLAKTQQEKDTDWQRKGKKYKTKYFIALKDLFNEVTHDTDCQTKESTN